MNAARLAVLATVLLVAAEARSKYKLDFGWRFHLGDDVPQAFNATYDDSTWRQIDVPHDFVVEGTFTPEADLSHGYLPFGVGWYRKTFVAPDEIKGRSAWLTFDGVQTSAKVFINGAAVAEHTTGYVTWRVPASSLVPGQQNVLAVRVDATAPDSWWYDGGGIYRHVWLEVAEPLHVQPWGVWAYSEVAGAIARDGSSAHAPAVVAPETTVDNDATSAATFVVRSVVTDAAGTVVAKDMSAKQTMAAGQSGLVIKQKMSIDSAALWSVETPVMYTLTTTIVKDGAEVDTVTTPFGVRKIAFDADKGFFLNDQAVKIKGMCNHQDFAGMGVALPDTMQEWRVKMLQTMGTNAWRTSHNSVNSELLDTCDKQGMLVWDENHRNNVDTQGIEDLKSMLYRDRNHPSIIYWSICNEALCNDMNGNNAKILAQVIHDIDSSRPVTAAMNWGWETNFSSFLDVVGFNYNNKQYDPFHANHPKKPLTGSETSSALTDRGVYVTDSSKAYISAYDVNKPSWGHTAEEAWSPISDREWMEGAFIWTGFDYKGEPTPYEWPSINSHFGIIDIAGFPKDAYYLYQSMWKESSEPILHLLPHWNGIARTRDVSAEACKADEVAQKWTFNASGMLVSSDGLCLSAKCWDLSKGCSPLQVTECDASDKNQVFSYKFGDTFVSQGNGGCLDLWGKTGPAVGVYNCFGTDNQHWMLEPQTGRIRSFQNEELCLTGGTKGNYVNVWAYTNAASVELFINGVSQGTNAVSKNSHAEWSVSYAPGTLSAKSYDADGNVISSTAVETTGKSVAIKLEAELFDRTSIVADGQDVVLIKASIVDAAGRVVPTANDFLEFSVSGYANIVGVGNGDPSCHEPDKASSRSAWNGLARVIVGATSTPGSFTVKATSSNLEPAIITIKASAPKVSHKLL